MHTLTGATALHWQQELEDLAISCCAAPASEDLRLTASLLALLSNHPDERLITGLSANRSRRLEMALEGGFAEAAVLQLLTGECGFMISHGDHEMFLASVCLPGAEAESTSSGTTLALAMIGAISLALVSRFDSAVRASAGCR